MFTQNEISGSILRVLVLTLTLASTDNNTVSFNYSSEQNVKKNIKYTDICRGVEHSYNKSFLR